MVGDSSAPVLLRVYHSYDCAFSRAYASTLDSLIARYPGRVAVAYTVMTGPLGSEISTRALGAECAAAQDKFAEYHHTLSRPSARNGNMNFVVNYVGLDSSAFARCMTDGNMAERIMARSTIALGAGITATPTTVVGERRFEGAISLAQLELLLK
jgi:protein-disulfide isomerase